MTSPEGFSVTENEPVSHEIGAVGHAALAANDINPPEEETVVYLALDDGFGDDPEQDDADDDGIETIDLAEADAIMMQEHLAYSGIDLPLDECKRLALISGNYGRWIEIFQETNYTVELLSKEPWLARPDAPNNFPFDKSEQVKNFWTADHSFAKIGDEWGKAAIGKIIRTRLKTDIDENLHDASQWLSAFKTPEKYQKANGEKGTLDEVKLYDHDLEYEVLWQILTATDEQRNQMNLPSKPHKVKTLFHDTWHRYLYTVLTERIQAGHPVDNQWMQRAIKDRSHGYAEEYERTRGMGQSRQPEDFQAIASGILNAIIGPYENLIDPPDETRPIPDILNMLAEYGMNRSEYVRDATAWLTRHMTSSSKRLTKVWGDRQLGLSEGIEDTAKSLEQWQKENAMRIFLDKIPDNEWEGDYGISKADISGKYGDMAKELLRHYSAPAVVEAIDDYSMIEGAHAKVPAAVLPLELNGKIYTGEILAKDDPRGMTIGPDTYCCMTLSGASRTCLWDGYQNPNAGFFALYNDDNKIMAQSYFYVNSGRPNVLVLDNIEANAGRDVNRIIKLYRKAFMQYLDERFANDPNWKIDTVQVGTGIGTEVKPYVKKLPKSEIILHPELEQLSPEVIAAFDPELPNFDVYLWEHLYSDATKDQRLLYKYGDKLPVDHQVFNDKNHSREVSTIETVPIDDSLYTVVQELEDVAYPDYLKTYNKIEQLQEDLYGHAASYFSQVLEATADDGTKDYRGYVIAYLTDSQIRPTNADTTLYVADLAVVPDVQGEQYGTLLMKGLLEKADAAEVKNIEMHTRESTSYAALKNSVTAKHLLAKYGYELFEPRAVIETMLGVDGVEERRRLVSLRKIKQNT